MSLSYPGSANEYETTLTTEFDVELSGNITGGENNYSDDDTTLSIVKDGSGKLTLSGNNTYTGTTTVEEGILSIASVKALSGAGYEVAKNATLDFAFTDESEEVTVEYDIEGKGNVSVSVASNKTVTLSGNKSYTYEGWTIINSGTLNAYNATLASTSLYIAGGATFVAPESDTYSPTKLIVNASNGYATFDGDLTMEKEGNLYFSGPTEASEDAMLVVTGEANIDGVTYHYFVDPDGLRARGRRQDPPPER